MCSISTRYGLSSPPSAPLTPIHLVLACALNGNRSASSLAISPDGYCFRLLARASVLGSMSGTRSMPALG